MGVAVKTTFFDKLWNWVLHPVADFFYPTNDCAVCYFWRAFLVGVWASGAAFATANAFWWGLFALVAGGAVGLAYLYWVDNAQRLDKQ